MVVGLCGAFGIFYKGALVEEHWLLACGVTSLKGGIRHLEIGCLALERYYHLTHSLS